MHHTVWSEFMQSSLECGLAVEHLNLAKGMADTYVLLPHLRPLPTFTLHPHDIIHGHCKMLPGLASLCQYKSNIRYRVGLAIKATHILYCQVMNK